MKRIITLFIGILFPFCLYAGDETKQVKETISGSYIGDFFTNAAGGIKQGSGYLGLGDLNLDLELPKNNRFFVRGIVTHGSTPSADFMGDRQVASNIEAGNHIYIQELWYKHTFNRFELTVGLQDLNVDFFSNEEGDFINSSFGIPPISAEVCPLPIFPLTGLGISGQWKINDIYTWKTVIFDGYQTAFDDNPHNLNWKLTSDDGYLIVSEVQATTQLKDRDAVYKAGAYYHSGIKDPQAHNRNIGAYWIANVTVNDRLNVFAQCVMGSERPDAFNPYLGLGASYKYKENNTFGLAVAHDGDWEKNYRAETTIECFYKRALGENISIKPDIQYIINPMGTDSKLKNALAGFVRLEINF